MTIEELLIKVQQLEGQLKKWELEKVSVPTPRKASNPTNKEYVDTRIEQLRRDMQTELNALKRRAG